MIAIEDHVHALKNEPLRIILERENAFAAENVRPLLRNEVLNPGEKLIRIQRLFDLERNRLHVLVVIVLEPVSVVVMIVIVTVVMIVRVVVIVGFEECRLDVETAV
jgi:hypothetical protein